MIIAWFHWAGRSAAGLWRSFLMVVWFFVANKRPFCHHLTYWILMFVVRTTNVSWLKPLKLSFVLFNWKVMVVTNFLSSKISWMKDLYVAHLVQVSSVWTIMTLNSPDIAFSNLMSYIVSIWISHRLFQELLPN